MFQIFRKGEFLGDVSVLKLSFSKKPEISNYSSVCAGLKPLTFEPLNLESLAQLPKNTFGYAYCEFLNKNNLKPLNFSKRVWDLSDRYPVTTRYARVHDMIHTLLGFGTDFAGELGVYAFIYPQNYCSILNQAAQTAKIFTRAIKPWAWRDLNAAQKRGEELAKTAKILIAEKLEDYLPRDLNEVRKQLGIIYPYTNSSQTQLQLI